MFDRTDLTPLFNHCLDVKRVETGLLPVRFSDEMLEHYARMGDAARSRSLDSAGITMDFAVEAWTRVELAFTARCFSRPVCAFDIYEDGVLAAHERFADECPGGTLCHTVGSARGAEGRVRVSICFPFSASITVTGFEAPGWEPVPGDDASERALLLGDSITQGMTVEHPSRSYAMALSRQMGWDWLNQGVGGCIFDAASLADVSRVGPDRILVAYGTNDFTSVLKGERELDVLERGVEAYFDSLAGLAGRVPVHVLTPIWRVADMDERGARDLFARVRATIARDAGAHGFNVVDGFTVSGRCDELFADGLHPNDLGGAIIAENIERHLAG